MKRWKQMKGITLIALVVTIIVLLILAGITISLVLGQNGIITRANEANIKQENATVLETMKLKVADIRIDILGNGTNTKEEMELKTQGYLDTNNIVNVEKIVGKKLKTGNGIDNDIYKVENGILNYYDKAGNKIELGEIYEEISKVTEADYFDFDPEDGSITLKDPVSYYYQWDKLSPIEEIVIPSEIDGVKVTKIGREYKLSYIHYFGFNAPNIKSIVIPDTVTEISSGAFQGCESLTSITIPNSVTTIGTTSTFSSCISLKELILPNEVTFSGNGGGMFYDCKSLKKVNLPNNMQTISSYFFKGCTAIENIQIPNSVTTIEDEAFSECTSLTNITIPDKVTYVGGEAFADCRLLKSINIPNTVNEIYSSAFKNCYALEKMEVAENGNYKNIDGVLYTKDGTTLVKCPAQVIPSKIEETTTTIDDYAFMNCTLLQEIVIPEKVTSLGYFAFEDCSSLTKISIPNSVTDIGMYAFNNCTSLTNITIEAGSTLEIPASRWSAPSSCTITKL